MIDVIPARPFMAERMELQSAQLMSGQFMTLAALESAIKGGMALAAVDEGTIIGMAGIYEIWQDRGMAWALLSPNVGARMTVLTRLAQRALDASLFRRVEAVVVEGHEEGHRWMQILGMQKEGVMRGYWQGRDYTLYAKVR